MTRRPGDIDVDIDVVDGRVVLRFGTAIDWIALCPDKADRLAEALRQEAARVRAERKRAAS